MPFHFGDNPLRFSEMLFGGNRDRPVLSVFFIHRRDNPFCRIPGCPCQLGKLKAQAYLELAEWGAMRVQSVPDFADGATQ